MGVPIAVKIINFVGYAPHFWLTWILCQQMSSWNALNDNETFHWMPNLMVEFYWDFIRLVYQDKDILSLSIMIYSRRRLLAGEQLFPGIEDTWDTIRTSIPPSTLTDHQ